MNKKEVLYGGDATDKIKNAVEELFKAVSLTLGPSGKHILIRTDKAPYPIVTKDGVTVASEVVSDDATEQMVIEIVQDVSKYADAQAGDGTTTAMVLAYFLITNGIKVLANDKDIKPFDLIQGMEFAKNDIVKKLDSLSEDVSSKEELLKVGTISTNGDDVLAQTIVDAHDIAGDHGIVRIVRSKTGVTHLTKSEGMSYSIGYTTPYFANREDGSWEAKKPVIYLTNKVINKLSDGLKLLITECNTNERPLFIMCHDMDSMVTQNLVKNIRKGALNVCVTKVPGFGRQGVEILHDTAIRMGCIPFIDGEEYDIDTLFKEHNDLVVAAASASDEVVTVKIPSFLDNFGTCDEIMCNMNTLSLKGGGYEHEQEKISTKVDARLKSLRTQADDKSLDKFEQGQLQARISRLSKGIAFIHVGGYTEIEHQETQHRVTDALHAVKAASEEGILPGGGYALRYIANNSNVDFKVEEGNNIAQSKKYGAELVFGACKLPSKVILDNVGLDSKTILKQLDEGNMFGHGYDSNRKRFGDMVKMGIIDPKKVTRVALENAVSIAKMLLTTDCTMVEPKVFEEYVPQRSY